MFNFFKKKRNKKIEQYEFIKKSFIEFFIKERKYPNKKTDNYLINYYCLYYRLFYDKKGNIIRLDGSDNYVKGLSNSNYNEHESYYNSSSYDDEPQSYAIFTKDFKTVHSSEAYKNTGERFGKYY